MKMLALALLLLTAPQFATETSIRNTHSTSVRIVPVRPSAEPTNVETRILFPLENQMLWSNPVRVQVRLTGYNVGTNSGSERAREIFNDPQGQSLLLFIDNKDPIEIHRSSVDSLDSNHLFYDLNLTKRLPFDLGEGMHVIRAFPARSYGESLKGAGCYCASTFYIGSKTNNLNVNLNAPYLTYNEPLETLHYCSDQPILLDFYLSNVQLSKDGFKVKVTVDETTERILTQWTPYYIYGLSRGSHTIRLQLLNKKGELVPGLFNNVTRTITVD